MNNNGQPRGHAGANLPSQRTDARAHFAATVTQPPKIAQPKNGQMSQQQIQQDDRTRPQIPVPHPSLNTVPNQLNRVPELSDLRSENLTEEEYREFLTEYIIYRLEKVESLDSTGDPGHDSWANCKRKCLPTVDKHEAKKAISDLNKEDRKKGRSLLEKQRSLTSIQQDQLVRLEKDLTNDVQRDGRFQIILAQIQSTIKPRDEKLVGRHSNTKRKLQDNKKRKQKYERTSINAYFKRCPRPEQVPSLLHRQLELEKNQGRQVQERQVQEQQAREQVMKEQLKQLQVKDRAEEARRLAQEKAHAEETRRIAQQQAQQQQQQAQLLKQQNQLQTQQAQLQKQLAMQQQKQEQAQQQQARQQQTQQAQNHGRTLAVPHQQLHPQGRTGPANAMNNQSHQADQVAAHNRPQPVQGSIGKQVPPGSHGLSRAEHSNATKVIHGHSHSTKDQGRRQEPSIVSSDSDSQSSDSDASSVWDSDVESEQGSDSAPTSTPSRTSASHHAGRKGYTGYPHVNKQLSHHGRPAQHNRHRPSHKDLDPRSSGDSQASSLHHHRSRRYSLHDERASSAYILTTGHRRAPLRSPHPSLERDPSPIISAKTVEAIREQAYREGRSDQKYEDQSRLAAVALESLAARRYQASLSSPSVPRYEPRVGPRPVIVAECNNIPGLLRHVSASEVERRLDRQGFEDELQRLRLDDWRQGHTVVRDLEDDYEMMHARRAPLGRRILFARMSSEVGSDCRWVNQDIQEGWDGMQAGRGGRLDRDQQRDLRSPPRRSVTSYRNPFSPEPLQQGRIDLVHSEMGHQRLF